jgi:hypothetical protein
MATTYTLIASNTVGSGGAASVTFSSIAATYTDLLLKYSSRNNDASANYDPIYVSFNGTPSGTAYSGRNLYGVGSAVGSQNDSSDSSFIYNYTNAQLSTANTFSNCELYIPNYTSSNYKSISADNSTENNSASNNSLVLSAGLWSNSTAISSIILTPSGGSFVQYSTFYLYGISNS